MKKAQVEYITVICPLDGTREHIRIFDIFLRDSNIILSYDCSNHGKEKVKHEIIIGEE